MWKRCGNNKKIPLFTYLQHTHYGLINMDIKSPHNKLPRFITYNLSTMKFTTLNQLIKSTFFYK